MFVPTQAIAALALLLILLLAVIAQLLLKWSDEATKVLLLEWELQVHRHAPCAGALFLDADRLEATGADALNAALRPGVRGAAQ